ncbi:hypothetical protein GCM10022243_03720 [Saccharothrix violaceirubra]
MEGRRGASLILSAYRSALRVHVTVARFVAGAATGTRIRAQRRYGNVTADPCGVWVWSGSRCSIIHHNVIRQSEVVWALAESGEVRSVGKGRGFGVVPAGGGRA